MSRHALIDSSKQNGILTGVIWKQLLIFFIPIFFGTLFQTLYNTVDAIVLGRFVGKEALAAVGSTGVLTNLLVGFFVGISQGATVIISQYYGAGDLNGVNKAIHTSIALALVGSIVFAAIGIGFSHTALVIMDTPDDVLPMALQYMLVYFAGVVFPMLYNICSGILRALGDSKRPLYVLILCCFTNLVLDLLFVLVFHMGVIGVAIATLISQAISVVVLVSWLSRLDERFRFRVKCIRFTKGILGAIIRIGLPAGLQSVMYSVSNIILQASINSFGTNTIAAWTAYGKVDALFWMMIGAFGASITTFVGQNFGARNYDRMKKSLKACLIMSFIGSFLLSSVIYLFGKYVMELFVTDSEVMAQGVYIIRRIVPFYFTFVCVEIISGAIRGTGDSIIPMLITCFGVCVLRIIWVYTIVPLNKEFGTVIMSYPVTWAVTSILYIIYYCRGNWLKRRIAVQNSVASAR